MLLVHGRGNAFLVHRHGILGIVVLASVICAPEIGIVARVDIIRVWRFGAELGQFSAYDDDTGVDGDGADGVNDIEGEGSGSVTEFVKELCVDGVAHVVGGAKQEGK